MEPILPCVEEITASRIEAAKLTRRREGVKKSLAPRPLFTNSLSDGAGLALSEGLADVFSEGADRNELFIGRKDLAEGCERNGSMEVFFEVEARLTEALMQRCRMCKLKMNGCVNMLVIIALKVAYGKYGVCGLEKVVYFNSISLRNYLSSEELENKTVLGETLKAF